MVGKPFKELTPLDLKFLHGYAHNLALILLQNKIYAEDRVVRGFVDRLLSITITGKGKE